MNRATDTATPDHTDNPPHVRQGRHEPGWGIHGRDVRDSSTRRRLRHRGDVAHGVDDVVLADEHTQRGVAEGDERVAGGDAPGGGHINAMIDESGQYRLADSSTAAGFVDHDDTSDLGGVLDDLVDRQRRQPAHVEHPARDPFGGEPLGRPQRQIEPVRPCHDQDVAAVTGERARPMGTCAAAQLPGATYGAIHPSSPAACRSRVW